MIESHLDASELTASEKLDFYRNGFIVLKDIVPSELTFEARKLINTKAGGRGGTSGHYGEISKSIQITNLINESALGTILRTAMGPYDRPTRGFAAILYPRQLSEEIGRYGVRAIDLPNRGWTPHLDGLWAGRLPRDPSEVDDWHAPKTEHFGKADASVLGMNHTPLYQNHERTVNIGSFTAFVGVCLNDQSEFGRGNLGLLKGAHPHVERFFQMQRAEGGPIGPEGPGWPRLEPVGNKFVGMCALPEEIRAQFKEDAEYTPDGTMWLKPEPILMKEGDAVIVLHAVPHAGSRNDGADPRMNVYFRIRRERPGGATVLGDSDHPDRGWDGEFLDYPVGYDPFKVAVEKLCDHWSEWDGMQEVVAEQHLFEQSHGIASQPTANHQ